MIKVNSWATPSNKSDKKVFSENLILLHNLQCWPVIVKKDNTMKFGVEKWLSSREYDEWLDII